MRSLSFFLLFSLLACKGDDKGGDDSSGSVEDLDGDGYSPDDGDCDDADASVNPGEEDVYCDGVDQDCSGADEDDNDGDGSLCDDDCDDEDASVYPGAVEVCGDGVDSDCEGGLECDCDEDGFDGEQCDGGDCDDNNAAVNPDGTDVCYDGIDDNCDGLDDYDCDRDDHVSADYGGDDCDDNNYEVSPTDPEVCADGIDNDCNETTLDCDCDLDGYDDVACGGTDCDDADATINPGASEASADGADNDCDEAIDEDAYCNVYLPTSNGSGALLDYVTLLQDGNTYTDAQTISDWDSGSGAAVFSRALNSSLSSYGVDENFSCVGGLVTMSGWALETSGFAIFTAAYTSDRTVLLPEAELVDGATWTFSYEAEDAALGLLWTVEGTGTVVGTESIEVTAGTFEALVVDYDYTVVDVIFEGTYSRTATTTTWYAPRLGVVYSLETSTHPVSGEDITVGERELSAYEGYYP